MERFLKKHVIALMLLTLIAVLAIATSIYYYIQYQRTQELLKNPSLAAQVEQQNLINRVGKVIDLPKDEEPTIATVSDYNKLKDQSFFKHAKNGDKVLIYTKAKKAILYDPIEYKIIEVGPVNLGSNQSTMTPGPASRVALYNGTNTVGLTGTVEKELTAQDTNIEVVAKDNASKNDYTKTVVTDLTGNQGKNAAQLAQLLHGEIGTLPAGEIKPDNTDIVVILGSEK